MSPRAHPQGWGELRCGQTEKTQAKLRRTWVQGLHPRPLQLEWDVSGDVRVKALRERGGASPPIFPVSPLPLTF